MSVVIERDDAVALVLLNRADKHNGVDPALLDRVLEAARDLRRDRSLRGVVIAGNGPSFCAGLDFRAFTEDPRRLWRIAGALLSPRRNRFQRFATAWRDLPVPVVAAVHGACFGAGLQLALACDFRIAAPDARFSIMEAKWGLVPDMSGTLTLRGLMAEDRIKELAMTGRTIDAATAKAWGMLTEVAEDPRAAARALLQEIATRSPDSVAMTKRLFHRTRTCAPGLALARERLAQLRLFGRRNQRLAMRRNLARGDGEVPSFQPRSVD